MKKKMVPIYFSFGEKYASKTKVGSTIVNIAGIVSLDGNVMKQDTSLVRHDIGRQTPTR